MKTAFWRNGNKGGRLEKRLKGGHGMILKILIFFILILISAVPAAAHIANWI